MEKCRMAARCGGCRYQGVAYEEQLLIKQAACKELLGRFCRVAPVTGMENPACYRAKVHHAFDVDRKGNIISGSYEEGTHRVVPGDDCMLEDAQSRAIIATVKSLLRSFKISVYNEYTGFGLLRHVMVRRGFGTGECMVVLVTTSPQFPSKNNFIKVLREKHPEITTVVLSVNDRFGSMVLGKRMIPLYGPGYINETLCGLTFRISPSAFFQVNPVMAEKLYQKAISLAGLTGTERVIDAYCGTGTIGLCAAGSAEQVIGFELNGDAVRDAIVNAKVNNIRNARFYTGDATEMMEEMAQAGEIADVVIMDPPRSGSTARFLAAAAGVRPRAIVYVSCNPETLARDIAVARQYGYRAKTAYPFDMFPFTEHVETVVLLVRKTPDAYVRIKMDMEDFDLTKSESKATYEEIKAYVKEQTGLNVTHLDIAQTKRKSGIIERESYNLPKSADAKQPQCTKEKEVAILDALKHFQMISLSSKA